MAVTEIHNLANAVPAIKGPSKSRRTRRGRKGKSGPRHPGGKHVWQPEDPITPERRRQGKVKLAEESIKDAEGRPAQPYIAVTQLMAMQAEGLISKDQRVCGERFQDAFSRARLVAIKAADMASPFVNGRVSDQAMFIERSTAVWRAILAVGGLKSSAGSCLWYVLGWDQPLNDWAFRRTLHFGIVTPNGAIRVLVRALADLEAYYRGEQRRYRRSGSGVAR
jgi:hypothetical protein